MHIYTESTEYILWYIIETLKQLEIKNKIKEHNIKYTTLVMNKIWRPVKKLRKKNISKLHCYPV